MTRLLRALGILATVGLLGYAGALLLADPDADAVVEDAIADAQDDEGAREEIERNRERLRRTARGLALSPEGPDPVDEADRPAAPVAAVPYGSGEVTEEVARDGFTYAMDRVDELAKSRQRVSQEEWDALYREANDAFAALSMVLDARDEAQAAELEAAHQRLTKGLGKVRVRGRKLAD